METPKSMTATFHLPDVRAQIYVRFQYEDGDSPASDSEIKLMGRVLDKAAGLNGSMQELLVRFAEYLEKISEKAEPE